MGEKKSPNGQNYFPDARRAIEQTAGSRRCCAAIEDGLICRVIDRGNNRQDALRKEADFEALLKTLGELKKMLASQSCAA